MCGLTGFLTKDSSVLGSAEAIAAGMADSIAHRGPDDWGIWCDTSAGIAMAHRRLSILDLSPAGHQPMTASSGRYVLSFNGEIYNHLQLRAELEKGNQAPQWRGHSDTETLLAAFVAWGLEATLTKAVGMFAMALWDTRDGVLSLARDRFGEKPLYYGWVDTGFVFGSELKALRAYPGFRNLVCREALAQYLRFMYVPAPRSIYQGVFKLEPGCLLQVAGLAPASAPSEPLRPNQQYGGIAIHRWWSLATSVERGARSPIMDESEAVAALEDGLMKSVKLQSLADVPLGAFLSGGVDSSTIVALMQKQSTRPVKTFTIGFEEAQFDEAPHAKAVAEHLHTDHTELIITAEQARAVIQKLPTMYDEPFADSSQIPTHLVCQAARQHVTVALSGDAGDELFGGYNRYFWGPSIWNRLSWLPYPARAALGTAVGAVPYRTWDSVGNAYNGVKARGHGVHRLGDKAHKLASRLRRVRNMDDLFLSLVSEWPDPAAVLQPPDGAIVKEPPNAFWDTLPASGVSADQLRMMYWDSITYLPDDILCKVDRAAMSVSLETRVPLLDHRIAETAWRLPLSMKIRGGQGKWALRQVLYRYVPRELIERPKAGFGIPVGEWLRGPLRDWAENLLEEGRLSREGYFRPLPIREVWAEHLSGRRDWTHRIWSILMFQSWLEENS